MFTSTTFQTSTARSLMRMQVRGASDKAVVIASATIDPAAAIQSKQHKATTDITNFHQLLTSDLSKRNKMHNVLEDVIDKIDKDQLARDIEAVKENGYVILENLITPEECHELIAELEHYLQYDGRNSFEGFRTRRVYTVAGKTTRYDPLIEHPRVLALLSYLLMPNFLLSMSQLIRIAPGEKPQIPHTDDGFYPWPRPRPALSAATIWAMDEFTTTNGATVVWPKSHLWSQEYTVPDNVPLDVDPQQPLKVKMSRGSCVFFLGTLWHGGGGNTSDSPRNAFTAQYCQPYLRTQENMFLGVSKEMAKGRSNVMKSMLGYSVHPPFVGQMDGVSPLRALL